MPATTRQPTSWPSSSSPGSSTRRPWTDCSLFLRNRGYQDDLPRKTLVQVFDLLGNDHPLVTAYRRKLYQALY